MKVAELKQELKKRGLPVSGRKEDLIERLEDAEENNDGSERSEESESESQESEEESSDDERATKKRKMGKKEDVEGGQDWSDIVDYLKDDGWKKALAGEFNKPYFKEIISFLKKVSVQSSNTKEGGNEIFPPKEDVFNAFNWTPLENVRCVILGQDPYHDVGQAHGLCFSVRPGTKIPPSLRNMYKELTSDIEGFKAPNHGSLEKWAQQGVLLLNATLTVQAHKANSHASCGWQTFTDAVIKVINQRENVVFILWGGFAQKKGKAIDTKKHCVIQAAHPSPLSVKKFYGCKVFSKTNEYLKSKGLKTIDWTLPKDAK